LPCLPVFLYTAIFLFLLTFHLYPILDVVCPLLPLWFLVLSVAVCESTCVDARRH
jgi:hypothetical protein